MSLNHSLSTSAFSGASGATNLGGRLEAPNFGNTSVQGLAVAYTPAAKTANYTVTANDCWVGMNTTAGALTATLPAAAAVPAPKQGQLFIVTDASGTAASNNITISAGSGTTLYGTASAGTISANRDSRRFIYVGTGYYQI